MSAKAVNDEATNTGVVLAVEAGDTTVTLTVPKKWKRFKFIKAISSGDAYGALSAVFGEDQLEPLFELDVDEDALTGLLESLAEALGGTDQGN